MSRILDEIRKAIEASDKTRYRLAKETGIDQATEGVGRRAENQPVG